MNSWEALLDELAERIAARVFERLRQGEPGMVAQGESPLGPRRHCNAVKRRVARHQPGAAIIGRRHLLSQEALREELAGTSSARALREEPADTPGNALRRKLGLPVQAEGSVRAELMAELAALPKTAPRKKGKRK